MAATKRPVGRPVGGGVTAPRKRAALSATAKAAIASIDRQIAQRRELTAALDRAGVKDAAVRAKHLRTSAPREVSIEAFALAHRAQLEAMPAHVRPKNLDRAVAIGVERERQRRAKGKR